jgi:Unconventional myosin tail, actin- and lipid-binding
MEASASRVSAAAQKRPDPFLTCQPSDYIGFSKNEKMWSLINDGECLLFADKIKKFRSCGWKQDRTFLISKDTIYNVKKDKIKRQINIAKLSGLSKTMLGAKNEFTIHVKDDYDYRFLTEHR